jgi:hypothetical protein
MSEAARTSAAASGGVNRNSRIRISARSPLARIRASGNGGSDRVINTISADDGRRGSREAICSWQSGSEIT